MKNYIMTKIISLPISGDHDAQISYVIKKLEIILSALSFRYCEELNKPENECARCMLAELLSELNKF